MKSLSHCSRAILCGALFTVAIAALGASDARAQETVILKNGQQIHCDRVERQGHSLVLFNRRRAAVLTDRQGNELLVVGSRQEVQIGTYTADQLSEATLMKWMPELWQQMDAQRQAAARAAQPPPPPPAPPPAVLRPVGQPQGRPAPLPPVQPPAHPPNVVALVPVPVFNGVKDPGNNIFVNSLTLQQTPQGTFFEGEITNISPLRMYDVRVILHSNDMRMIEAHDVARIMEGDSRGKVLFRLPVAVAEELSREPMLVIRCFAQPPSQEIRKATFYTFKIERLTTGQFSATPFN